MKRILTLIWLLLVISLLTCACTNGTKQDGAYTIAVALSGGSGRASVASPAEITFTNGEMTARIIWSSPNYDLMLVDGVKYLPVSTKGNSTFEIPIAALDQEIAVSAETTAMSQPHMIDYTLRFDATTLKQAGEGPRWWIILAVLGGTGAAAAFAIISKAQKRRREVGHNA